MSNTQHVKITLPASGAAVLSDIAAAILGPFDALARASEASREAESLFRMNDEQLARRGLTRDDISRHIITKYF